MAVTLLAGAAVLGPAGSSHGADPCGIAIDAGDFATARDAGDALRAAFTAALGADLTGCDEWRADLAGTFALAGQLLWPRAEPLVLAGPEAADGPPARLEAVTAGAPGSDVTHRILAAVTVPGVTVGTVGPVTIERLVLTGGAVQAVGGNASGGAVLADVVHLVDSELTGNTADRGGAVVARKVHAERVSLVDNSAVSGDAQAGAIRATQKVTLVNVTLAGNVASEGGGVWLAAAGTFDATFVTFVGNSATTAGTGADLHRALTGSGDVTLRGVLFAGVAGASAGPSCGGVALPAVGSGLEVAGTFEFVDDVDDASCTGVTPSDDTLTFTTVPFLTGTAAIPVPDGGPASIGQVACGAGWPGVDQRGVARPQGGTCDAGAVEREAVVVPPPPVPPASDSEPEPGPEAVVDGPVPTSVPAGDGACADGCPALGSG